MVSINEDAYTSKREELSQPDDAKRPFEI